MGKSRLLYLFICLALVITLAGGFVASRTAVSAQDATPTTPTAPTPTPTPPALTLKCDVPSYADDSGATFSYDVVLSYNGDNRITVNLSSVSPTDWDSYISYSSKQVSSVEIGPQQYGSPDTKTLTIYLYPKSGKTPDPGSYKLALKAVSGTFNLSIDLTANVKAKYTFSLTTDTGNLTTQATAGKDNNFSINLVNGGTAALDNLNFSADKPEGWTVTFNPEKVTSVDPGATKVETVVIKPPEGKTVAGDYVITLHASNDKVNQTMQVRVTVLTPSIWGWVGIIIIVVVIVGLALLFMRLGRR